MLVDPVIPAKAGIHCFIRHTLRHSETHPAFSIRHHESSIQHPASQIQHHASSIQNPIPPNCKKNKVLVYIIEKSG
jgi:hypothetical protein